jgi:hypothetical protein
MDASQAKPLPASHAASGKTAASGAPWRIWFESPGQYSTRKIQALKHNFDQHPQMQLPELAKLAKDLVKTKQCRFITPGSQQATPFHHEDHDPQGRDIDEVFRRIEEPGSWIALYNVETHPVYKKFLDDVVACFKPMVEREQPNVFNVGGFIFISAPPSVTPFHIDRENNFWLQVAGRKVMNVWDPTDHVVVPAHLQDQFILYGDLDEVRLKDGFKERSHEFDVGPGDGVYFPSTSPHMTRSDPGWTQPGNGVSISIGVVFYTDVTKKAAYLHALNLILRQRFGIEPRPPGESAFVDALKYPFGRLLVWAKKLGGYKPKAGF